MGAQLDGGGGGAEDLGRLADRQTLVLDELEGRPVTRGQALDFGLQGADQPRGIDELVGTVLIGGGLHGARLVAACLERDGAALVLAPANAVDEQAAGDREGPGQDLGAGDETTTGAMDLQHRLLKEVVRTAGIAAGAEEIPTKPRCQRIVELGKRLIVPARVALHGGVRPLALGVAGSGEGRGPARFAGRGPRLFAGGRHFSRPPGQRGGEGWRRQAGNLPSGVRRSHGVVSGLRWRPVDPPAPSTYRSSRIFSENYPTAKVCPSQGEGRRGEYPLGERGSGPVSNSTGPPVSTVRSETWIPPARAQVERALNVGVPAPQGRCPAVRSCRARERMRR